MVIPAFYDAVFDMGIITQIYVVQNNRILDNAVISHIYFLKQNRILHLPVDDTAAGYQAVLYQTSRIIFCRRKIVDLGVNSRILTEEIISHFRFQEIHIGLVVSLNGREVVPVILDLISIDPLQILIADQNIFYKSCLPSCAQRSIISISWRRRIT